MVQIDNKFIDILWCEHFFNLVKFPKGKMVENKDYK